MPYLYFQRQSGYSSSNNIIIQRNFADSVLFSFVGIKDEKVDTLLPLPIKLLGKPLNKPLKLKFRINKELTTAIENSDFTINLDTIVLKSGTVNVNILCNLLRSPKLLTKTFCIAIDLVETEEYSVLEEYNNTDIWNKYQKKLSGRTYRMFFGEVMTEPSYWGMFGIDYFGKWTVSKFKLLNNLMSWTVADWNNAGQSGANVSLGSFAYAAFQLQTYLQAQADAGKPIRDEDGQYMQLPGNYAVDYSGL